MPSPSMMIFSAILAPAPFLFYHHLYYCHYDISPPFQFPPFSPTNHTQNLRSWANLATGWDWLFHHSLKRSSYYHNLSQIILKPCHRMRLPNNDLHIIIIYLKSFSILAVRRGWMRVVIHFVVLILAFSYDIWYMNRISFSSSWYLISDIWIGWTGSAAR